MATISPSPPSPNIAPDQIDQFASPKKTCNKNYFTYSSESMLKDAEQKILSFLKTSYRGGYVDIGSCVGKDDKIWTLQMNTESPKVPLVLLHGFAAGVGLWVLNLDAFAKQRPVYAIDLLGFGRSSRPKFASNPEGFEKQMVQAIEEWRKKMNISKMIVCGHSFGGYLATSYSIAHPDRVKHLILADAWGFPVKPKEVTKTERVIRGVAFVLPRNPLWLMRVAGPYGQGIIRKLRADIVRRFDHLLKDDRLIPEYIFQCNARPPTGESAFQTMLTGIGYAKNPMIERIPDLRADIPMTILRGARSWIKESSMEAVCALRTSSFVNFQQIPDAGHHVYSDQPDIFNELVLEACSRCDGEEEQQAPKVIESNVDTKPVPVKVQ